jgi:hypothetical protein
VANCSGKKVATVPNSQAPTAPGNAQTATSYEPSKNDIVGEWYVVATNPAFVGAVVTDYISWGFGSDENVRRVVRNGEQVETNTGSYTWDKGSGEVAAELDLGDAGVQVFTWKLQAPELASIVRWQNVTHGKESQSDELFVKKGSPEWQRRGKKAVNLAPHVVADNMSLAPKDGRRIQLHVQDEQLSRSRCADLLREYLPQAGREGQVSVRKPNKFGGGELSPWCIDNRDGYGATYNDDLFNYTE